MRFALVLTIFAKELRDMLRDRRTLIAMIAVPVLLYPILFLVFSQVMIIQQERIERAPSTIALEGEEALLRSWLEAAPRLEIEPSADPEADLLGGRVHAVVRLEEKAAAALETGGTADVTILYDAMEHESTQAATRAQEALDDKHEALLETRVREAGLDPAYMRPLKIQQEDAAPAAKTGGAILGMVLPVIMVLMLGVGAFYPAVDLTAGEKERGTFETLLSTPTSKLEIVAGKFLTVFCISLLTGLMNLASMLATFWIQIGQLDEELGGAEIHLAPVTGLIILAALIPLAFFISALMMSVAVFARSFREAQNFVTPFFVLITLPPALVALPGVTLSAATQFLPIANVALLFKTLMTEPVAGETMFAVFFSTGTYALLSLVLAAWIFQREDVVLSQQRGIPLSLRRAEFPREPAPTPGFALFLYGLAVILLFYAGTYVQARNIFTGILITQWGLILLPVAFFLWYVRVNFKQALLLYLPRPTDFGVSLLIAAAWILIIIQIGVWHEQLFPMPEELGQYMQGLFAVEERGVWGLLFIVALSPAVCEEVLHRGVLLSGLRRTMPAWTAIIVTALLFGLFHLSIHRLLLTTLSGIVLGYLVWRNRSLITGMVVHFCINASAVLAMTGRLPAFLRSYVEEGQIEEHGLPWPLFGFAVAVFAAGVTLMEWRSRRGVGVSSPSQDEPQT
ncbi:MAG: ABC transporter permease subunit/CPBP intramembrane protease [Candidatus Hydrogenedentota bacterium]